jgi:hypothetical protein
VGISATRINLSRVSRVATYSEACHNASADFQIMRLFYNIQMVGTKNITRCCGKILLQSSNFLHFQAKMNR